MRSSSGSSKSRPMQEAICAVAFITGDPSSRAISESRSVAGTETASPAGAVSMTALVISSMNRGMPSLRARISFPRRERKLVLAGYGGDECARCRPVKPGQSEATQVGCRANLRLVIGTARDDNQHRHINNNSGEVPHQFDGRRIGPLGIFEHDKRRTGPGAVQQLSRQCTDGFVPVPLAIEAIRVDHARFNNRHRGRQLLLNWPERIVAVERRTLKDMLRRLVLGGDVCQGLQQAGFADPGFTGHQHRLATTRFRLFPGKPQRRQFCTRGLRLAPDPPRHGRGNGSRGVRAAERETKLPALHAP